MPGSRVDLHTHTTASDGVHAPAELVRIAAERGLDVLGVTDHDTVAGVAEAARAGAAAGIEVVAGIEVSSRHDGRAVHVLGLFVDPEDATFREVLARAKAQRLWRARGIVERLNDLGYELDWSEVEAQAGGDVVARPHIARALVARGYVRRVGDAFTAELIGDGGRALVRRDLPSPAEAVALIRRAGGAAVLAHPAITHHAGHAVGVDLELVESMAAAGLAGLEVDHPDHNPRAREHARTAAERFDLVPTGGSDFHGHEGTWPGSCTTDPECLARLRERAGAGA